MLRSLVSIVGTVACVLALAAGPGVATAQPDAPADSAQVTATYEAAFRALLEGEVAAAARGFERVASASADAEQRAAARELARLARELERRGANIELTRPPGAAATPADAAAVEDHDEGRTSVMVATTAASFYSGFVLLDVADIDDFRAAVTIVAGTTGAGFLASYLATYDREITGAMADGYALGMGLGVGNGLLLSVPLGLEDSEDIQLMALGGIALGSGVGLALADHVRPTRGQVSFVGTMSILGIATTGGALGMIQPEGLTEDEITLILTAGLDTGAAVGMSLAPDIEWSTSRARLASLGVFLGGLGGWASAAIATGAEPGDDGVRLWSGATLAGMWAGFGLAAYWTRGMDPDPRFAEADPLAVSPTVIRDAPGLSISGLW